MLLGVAGLRSVLSAAVMQPIIQRDSPYFFANRTKAVAALTALRHRLRTNCPPARGGAFSMYLLGLVHDVGKITLFI